MANKTKFLTEREIVFAFIFNDNVEVEDLKEIASMKYDDLITLHHTLGRYIRNKYNLWDPENPLTLKDYVPQIIEGVDCSPRHPDQVSFNIIQMIWHQLQEMYNGT